MTNRLRRGACAFTFTAVTLAAALSSAQSTATSAATKRHVTTLASERLEGRLVGSTGETLASEYLISELRRIGAKPLPGRDDYRLPFEFTAGTRDAGSSITLTRGTSNERVTFMNDKTPAIRALSFSDNGEVTAPLVFAGYGIVVPDSQDFGYDSYATLDVKDKIVLVLRYFPEDADAKTKGILARYSDLRYKALAARQRGAKGMLVVAGPRSPNAGELIPMTFDTALAGSGIVAASLSGTVARELLRSADKSLDDLQKSLDTGNPHVAGFAVPEATVSVKANLAREKRTASNVAAYLPATLAPLAKSWVIVGAHYDHLGRGDHGSSLADKNDAGKVHAGADDNASGSAAVLALAESLAAQPRARHIMLTFWSGEELGLLGSGAFVNQPPIPLNEVAAYLNFDMVGRMRDNKLTVQATGSSPSWPRLLEQMNVAAGFDLQVQADPFQPTDVSSFNQASIPSLNFFTGVHADYHKPSDTADKIDYEDLDRIVEFATTIVRRVTAMETPPQFAKVDQPAPGGGRAGVRVYTGTMPDYSTEVKGLLLSGVVAGGPADAAGLQKGDVIVEIAGQSIANVYDYTYALDVLKVGEAAKVVYLRGGQKRETTLTPTARK